jgi:transposase InsO family protein
VYSKGHDAILVVVDRFTKYALYIETTAKLSAEGFANLLLYHVYRHFRPPEGIVLDRSSLFTSRFWETLCKALGTCRKMSTAYHPQTDGQTERQNQILEQYLRTFCNQEQDDWASLLPLAQYAYNTS